ncbi:ABC transporter permease [Alloacidobacterium dinghuense]|uniref:ABC transporter permease n=1 Tax=Alloacidobacterium dinghuense TaxID=2763107 RepID=UPI0020367957|nr:ABC transporter permease [Alloacidobacterium dinghuense]
MVTLLQDIRYAFRQLHNHLGFALTAILSLALGIGATVSVFSVIYGVLLHPFPYADVDRLANLSIRDQKGNISDAWFSGQQLRELRNVHAFENIASWRLGFLEITGGEIPENVRAYFGIGETFPTLRVPPLLGRNLGPSDSPDGQEPQPVAVLHYRFWQRHFNGDPAIIGKTLELDHKRYTIVGVTRPNFTEGWGTDVYLPQEIGNPLGGGVMVKLRPGVSLAAADAEMQPLLDRYMHERPLDFPKNAKVDIRLLTWEITHNMGSTLYLLFGAVAMLLAIGCSNVSILLLARGTARQHEFAVRAAVGAGSIRIVRQLLTESLMLALTGAVLGVMLASRLLVVIIAWLPPRLFPPDVAIHINLPVLLFSVVVALLTTVFFGLIPALQMAKPEISRVMQSATTRAAGSVRGKRLHAMLVAAQIALTMMLLTVAGAAIESFIHILRVPLGYNPHNVVSVGIPLRENTYTNWQARVNYFEQLRASIAALPDVISASITTGGTPPGGGWWQRFDLLGKPSLSPESQYAKFNLIDSDYFRTLQTPLLEGRAWTPAEIAHGTPLAIVNQTFARQYFPEGSILGHSLKVLDLRNDPGVWNAPEASGWMQIIGVVADSINDGVDQPTRPAMFVPYSTQLWMGTQFLVRTRIAPDSLQNSIRRQIALVNPNQPAFGAIASLEKWIRDEPVWARGRLISALFAGFSILALILSAVGLYSVVSYSVAQRTNEFGIRIALGAQKSDVSKIVLASAGISVGLGVLTGLALSLGLHRFISGWVGNTTNHPLTHPLIVLSVSLLLVVVAVMACLMPARRASSVDPMTALRCD